MNEEDRLRSLLREWQAPEPPSALDQRVRAHFRDLHPSLWRRIWTTRISVPLPVMAAAMLALAAVLWLALRPASPATVAPRPNYAHKTESAGFQPLPNGAAHVIEMKEQ